MAFEYDDNDLGLDDEELEGGDGGDEPSWLDIADDARKLFTDDEEEEDDNAEEDNEDNDTDLDRDDLDSDDNDTSENKEKKDTDSNDNNSNDTDSNRNKTSDDTKTKSAQNEPSGRYGDTPPSQAQPSMQGATPTAPTTSTGASAGTSTASAGASATASGAGAGAAASSTAAGASAGAATTAATTTATTTATTAAGSSGITALFATPVGWIILGVILVIIIVLIITMAVSLALDEQEKESMLTNSTITSEYFYGMRVVYEDAEILQNSLQLSYKQYVIDILQEADEMENVDLAITLPTEFDNSTAIDQNITNISLGIGNIVANDNASYQNIDFSTLYPNIAHFGLTTEQANKAHTFMIEYLEDNNILTISNESSVKDIVESVVAQDELQYIYNICEKVMIKDVVATSSNMPAFDEHKYIACIYMPKSQVSVSEMAYRVKVKNDDDTVDFKVISRSGGSEKVLIEENADRSWDANITYAEVDAYTELTLNAFEKIDATNTGLYSNGVSLFEALKLQPTGANYFVKNAEGVYTWTPDSQNLLYLTFTSINAFKFNEFNITIN